MTLFLDIGFRADTAVAISLLNACTIHHPPVALRTPKIGELWCKVDSLTSTAAKQSTKNLSIANPWSQGSGYWFIPQYFEPGTSSISCWVPSSQGKSHGTDLGVALFTLIKFMYIGFAWSEFHDWKVYRSIRVFLYSTIRPSMWSVDIALVLSKYYWRPSIGHILILWHEFIHAWLCH